MDRETLLREAAEEQLLREATTRRFLYADVEMLVTEGYLLQRVDLEGQQVVLRTVTEGAHIHLAARCDSDPRNWKRHHIAHAVYMVDGYIIDQTEPNAAYHVYREWLQDVRIETIDVLHTYTLGLRDRLGRACRLTNAFCNEEYSRALWRRQAPSKTCESVVQHLWRAYNESEDAFEDELKKWQHTRSIAGSMSAKAAKALKKSEDEWKERRATLAQKSIEDAVNWVINGEREDQEPVTVTVNGQVFTVPRVHASQSVDEMQDELMRAVRGEKDYHDHMVEQYKAFHRAQLEESRRERQEALDKARKASDERGISGTTTIVGYTPEQLAQINPSILVKPAARVQQAAPERQRFDKYLHTGVGVGWIGTSGQPEAAVPVGGAPEAAPEDASEKESLQSKISRRNPRLKP